MPAARYCSMTSLLIRPRGETLIPLPAAQARTAAGSTSEKAGWDARALRRPPETLRAAWTYRERVLRNSSAFRAVRSSSYSRPSKAKRTVVSAGSPVRSSMSTVVVLVATRQSVQMPLEMVKRESTRLNTKGHQSAQQFRLRALNQVFNRALHRRIRPHGAPLRIRGGPEPAQPTWTRAGRPTATSTWSTLSLLRALGWTTPPVHSRAARPVDLAAPRRPQPAAADLRHPIPGCPGNAARRSTGGPRPAFRRNSPACHRLVPRQVQWRL